MFEAFELQCTEQLGGALPVLRAVAQRQYADGARLRLASGRDYRLLSVVTGKVQLSETEVCAGSCFLLVPGQTVLCTFSEDTVLSDLCFQCSDLVQPLMQHTKHNAVQVFSIENPQCIPSAVQRAVHVPEGCAPALYRAGLLCEILSCLPAQEKLSEAEAYGKQAMEYIRQNYMRPIGVNDVAAAVGVSRSWLYRCFMDYAAQPPAMFLRDVRMLRAKSLLRRTDLPVQEVARAVGFEDPLYFSRVFTAYEGCSPSAYRK